MIHDRLSWMWFLGFDLGAPTPDENTIRHFRNRLTETGTLKRVMKAFDWQLQSERANATGPRETANEVHPNGGPDRRWLADGTPIVRETLANASTGAEAERNTEAESEPVSATCSRERANAIKEGKTATEIWPDEPNKAAQKDTNARWTPKIGGKIRYRPDGTPLPMIGVPVFGYKSHIAIDRRYGFIRESAVTAASAADGRQLRRLVGRENTGSEVWASRYRSAIGPSDDDDAYR
ncbi:MAG: transposase, partial [Pseudomonadota bacterium]